MKILFIDNAIDGHHANYLLQLSNDKYHEYIAVLPEDLPSFNGKVCVCGVQGKRSLISYLRWLKRINKIIEKEKPNVVHFLNGDFLYRYFGIGLRKLKELNLIITMHWVRNGFLHRISLLRICRSVDSLVVHSAYLKDLVLKMGAKNVKHIEYPRFGMEKEIDSLQAKDYWNLDTNVPVLAAIGGTREDKGLDILLKALQNVDTPFQLLIAGKEEFFNEEYIKSQIKKYSNSVRLVLRFLTSQELENAIWAADIIVLPYRKIFTGASGPLVEGVWCEKCIVGPNHGNLGYTIQKNHLGYTFETENVSDLAKMLNLALLESFIPDGVYLEYKNALRPELFTHKYFCVYEDVMANIN